MELFKAIAVHVVMGIVLTIIVIYLAGLAA